MTLSVSSAFDGGNIRVVAIDGDRVDLEIVKDNESDFYQWFYFRVTGGGGQPLELRILNCAGAAYPHGWEDYRACMSDDREEWERVETSYDGRRADDPGDAAVGQRLVRLFRALHDGAASRSGRRVRVLSRASTIARSARRSTARRSTISSSAAGRCRSGSTPASIPARRWPNGGWKARSSGCSTSPIRSSARLREAATFHIVPNMNPDGSRRGHLRTNAAGVNLNREWHAPSLEQQPRGLPRPRRDGQDRRRFRDGRAWRRGDRRQFPRRLRGHPVAGSRRSRTCSTLSARRWSRATPDFQTAKGYEIPAPGQANLSMSTAQLAERFGAVSMTLEMPFKDNDDLPDPVYGWSPERCRLLARACLDALHADASTGACAPIAAAECPGSS